MLLTAVIGLSFGFFGSIPIAGPIAVMVVSRGVEGRWVSGMGLAAGAAVAEGIYALLAFLGFSTILSEQPWILPTTNALASVVLLALGIHFIRWRPRVAEGEHRSDSRRSFVIGFAITAMNPTLIATWSAAIATLFSAQIIEFRPLSAVPFSVSTIIGILLWFSLLLWLIHKLKTWRGGQLAWLTWVVRAMGVFLLVLSAWFASRIT